MIGEPDHLAGLSPALASGESFVWRYGKRAVKTGACRAATTPLEFRDVLIEIARSATSARSAA